MERRCSKCIRAQENIARFERDINTVIVVNGVIVNNLRSKETSWSFTLTRKCEGMSGTKTVTGFDKCINRRMFRPNT